MKEKLKISSWIKLMQVSGIINFRFKGEQSPPFGAEICSDICPRN